MVTQYLLFVTSLFALGTNGHDWGFGSCPSVAPFPNLSLEKFLGLWYVIEQFDTSSTCLTFNYTRKSETALSVTKNRQFYILDRAGLDHTNSYTGTIDIPFSTNQGQLRVKWPLNAAGKSDYIIFDTDYDKYAGVYDCQQLAFFMFRQSAAILSRTPELDSIYVDRVKRRLESYKVDTEEFSIIDHSKCPSKETPDLKINVDENTFKNFFSDAAGSVKDAATKFAGGVQNITSTVIDGVKSFSNPEEVVIQEAAEVKDASPDLNDIELLN